MNTHENINRIIESSSELFAVYGYDGTSISEICKAGNISKGRFYYYFNDKEDLFISCCKYTYTIMNKLFELFKVDKSLSLSENLLNLFACYQKIFENYKFVPYIIYTINSSPPPAVREARKEIVEFHQNKFLQLIKEILDACNIEVDAFHIAIGFHTAFMSAYEAQGVLDCKDLCEPTGNDVYDYFNYYIDKILFGVLPRDKETMDNPKAARDI